MEFRIYTTEAGFEVVGFDGFGSEYIGTYRSLKALHFALSTLEDNFPGCHFRIYSDEGSYATDLAAV